VPSWRKVLIVSIYARCDMIWFINQFKIEASMFKFFKPRNDVFHKLIGEQSAITLEGLKYLVKYIEIHDPEIAGQLSLKEKEADETRRILIDELNHTFRTPFNREDIFTLSRTIDDVLDYAHSTVTEMEILNVESTPYMLRMASLLKDAAYEIHQAVLRLKKHPGVAIEHAQRAKALENRVEAVYREALADLFSGPENLEHLVEMLKLREVYRHLSNAADRGDEAANAIADIIVKRR
jgi:predicted phosphate transport protein (TIGR00153 family)